MTAPRKGVELIHRFRSPIKIIAITLFQGQLMIATEKSIYRMLTPTSKPEKLRFEKKEPA